VIVGVHWEIEYLPTHWLQKAFPFPPFSLQMIQRHGFDASINFSAVLHSNYSSTNPNQVEARVFFFYSPPHTSSGLEKI
jgi:hypothetical protein